MHTPPITTHRGVAPGVDALGTHLPVPGLGVLPVHAFLIRSAQPVLVDAGVEALADETFEALGTLIDPADLRWIWLTHADADHTGCLERLLRVAPQARLVTTFLGLAKLGLRAPVPAERAHLLEPGQALDVGDRRLACLRPPTYDAPETTAVFDSTSRTYFSADAFGAVLEAPVEDARAVAPGALRDGMVAWAGIDAPWLALARPEAFERALRVVTDLAPRTVLSSHLPPAHDLLDALTDHVRAAVGVAPAPGPDQAACERLLGGTCA